MAKTTVSAYFTLTGEDFDVDYVTQVLGIQPTYLRDKNEVLGNGRLFGHTEWGTNTQLEESKDIEIQVDKVIAPYLDKVDLLNMVQVKCNAEWSFGIVVYSREDGAPAMGFSKEQLKFFASIEAKHVDIDFYVLTERTD